MRYGHVVLGAVALVCLGLGACASERPESEGGERSEAQAVGARHDQPGAIHAQPSTESEQVTARTPSETTRPQTDPWAPAPVDSGNVRDRPQTDPWRPKPDGADPAR